MKEIGVNQVFNHGGLNSYHDFCIVIIKTIDKEIREYHGEAGVCRYNR